MQWYHDMQWLFIQQNGVRKWPTENYRVLHPSRLPWLSKHLQENLLGSVPIPGPHPRPAELRQWGQKSRCCRNSSYGHYAKVWESQHEPFKFQEIKTISQVWVQLMSESGLSNEQERPNDWMHKHWRLRLSSLTMTRLHVPVFQQGPAPTPQLVLCHCFLFASSPPALVTGRDYPTLHQSTPTIFWEWDIQLAFFLSVFTHWKKVIVSLRLRMNQAVLTLSLLTGVQKSNQLLINTCDKINLIFFS